MQSTLRLDHGAIKSAPTHALTLLEFPNDEPRVDARPLAHELGIKEKNFIGQVRRYELELRELGKLAFQTRPSPGSRTGQVETFVLLNEAQAIFLMTLSRNTPQVVALKLRLTKLFSAYHKAALQKAKQQFTLDRAKAREAGIQARKEEAGVIEAFLPYAQAQGSRHPEFYRVAFVRMVMDALGLTVMEGRRATWPKRDQMDAPTLTQVQMVEKFVTGKIIEGMAANHPYKSIYRQVKAAVLAFVKAIQGAVLGQGQLVGRAN